MGGLGEWVLSGIRDGCIQGSPLGIACGPAHILCLSDTQDEAKAVGDLGEDLARNRSDWIGLDEFAADRAHLRNHCNGVLPKPRRINRHEHVA